MIGIMNFECGILWLVLLLYKGGAQAQLSVTLSSQSLCAVTGSTVKILCNYTKPYSSSIREWYQVQRSDGEPRDLSKVPQYSERVSVSTGKNDCTLTMINVTVSDAGDYNFRFKMESSEWTPAPSGTTLTVTDLQVKVDPETLGQRKVKLTCSSTCSFSTTPQYYWFRNGKFMYHYDSSIMLDSSSAYDEGSYSCMVSGSSQRSPAVCVLGKQCWGVTYTPEHICALKGSSVDLSCSYKYLGGHTVRKSFWFFKEQQLGVEPVDVSEEEDYQGRVQYTHSSQNDCSMTLTHLRESDAHTYKFRFHTDGSGGKYTGEPGVTLSVTDLKVTVSGSSSQKHLICSSTCTLSHNPTYIWYRNGQRVSHCTSASCSVSAVSDGESYSCATEGHENLLSPPVYPPRNTRAAVVPSGGRVEGDSVTLTCSSDANPPVLTYSWFKQRAAADTLLATEQNYSITNINSQHSGLYYCTAHNQLGQHNSTTTLLDVLCIPARTYVASGVTVGLFLTLTAVFLWMRGRTPAVSRTREVTSANTASSDDQEDIQYSSVHFTRSQTKELPLYYTVKLPKALNQEEEIKYSTVNIFTTRVSSS